MTNSIWENVRMPAFSSLHGDCKTDVLIIGGGIAGILCAHKLKQAGADCLLLEAGELCGGITKNTTAKLSSQHGLIYSKLLQKSRETAQAYLRANEDALESFRTLCRDIPCDFEEKPSYVYTTAHPEKIEAELAALQTLGYGAEYACELPLPFSTKGAVKFPNQAQFQPLAFLSHVAGPLNIHTHTSVRQLTPSCAITDHGEVHFDKLIIATHFPFLNKHGMFFLKLYQQRSYVLALKNVSKPEGMYIGDTENSLSFRSFGSSLLFGGCGHRTGKQSGGWVELMSLARKYYPQATVTHRWATQDCMSLDGMPYIGQYSKNTPNVFVASGFNKWGMTWSMAAADILADLVLEKSNPYAPFFSPQRSMLTPQLGTNALESAVNLLSFGKKRCPHMGCALKWNRQERSWDCPCHGSRFSQTGKLLDNPATGDLPE